MFKEVKVSTALPCSEGPVIIFSDTLSTWVLKTHLIEKKNTHFFKAKFLKLQAESKNVSVKIGSKGVREAIV